jgi:hypothetical protein
LFADTIRAVVEAITVAVGAGGGVANDDGFAAFADFIKFGFEGDLGGAFAAGG